MSLRFKPRLLLRHTSSTGVGLTSNRRVRNSRRSILCRPAVFGLRRLSTVNPVLKASYIGTACLPRYSLYPEYATLRYFSYVIAIVQRSGKRLSCWNVGAEVMSVVNQLTQSKYDMFSFELGGANMPALNGNGQRRETAVDGILDKEVSLPPAADHLASHYTSGLVYALWLRSDHTTLIPVTQPQTNVESHDHASVFSQVCQRLKVSFLVRYRSLDRKLRKIVKNKYRYSRSYVMLKPSSRIKQGLRFILLGLALRSNQKIRESMLGLISDLLFAPQSSILLEVRDKHQSVALTALTLNR